MTMLDSMRRHKNWLKWSLALVVLAFVALYFPSYMDTTTTTIGASPTDVVATVNGTDIKGLDYQRRYQNQMMAYQQQYGGNINQQLLRQLGIDQQILQQMVDEQAALAEAERQGIRVSDEELAQQIFSIPGLGREIITAVNRSDFPVIKAVTVYLAMITMIVNLLVDVMYKFVDPRVSFK